MGRAVESLTRLARFQPTETAMREEQDDDLIDLGAASALTLGDMYDTKDESLIQPDSWH
jgi:hypothetical protein